MPSLLMDFDGVVVDSAAIKDGAFRKIATEVAPAHVEAFMRFHRRNGGLSRYEKFRFLLNDLVKVHPTEAAIQDLATSFSGLVTEAMKEPEILIRDCVEFIERNARDIEFFLVSAADEAEVIEICRALGVDAFFRSIHGSPTAKVDNVSHVLSLAGLKRPAAYVGDSINDLEAARANLLPFIGYNNAELRPASDLYIESFLDQGHQVTTLLS